MEADNTQIYDTDIAGISKSRHHHALYHGSSYIGSPATHYRPDNNMPGRLRTRALPSQQDEFDTRSSKGVEDNIFVTPKQNFHRYPTNAAIPTETQGRNREAATIHKQLQKEIKDIIQAEIKAIMRSLTKELLEQFGRKIQKILQNIMGEMMKEIDETATAAAKTAIAAAQSAQTTWANVAATDMHHQAPDSDTDEPHMVIPARCNREALVHPDPDILTSNNTPNTTVKAINITLTNSKTMAV